MESGKDKGGNGGIGRGKRRWMRIADECGALLRATIPETCEGYRLC
jgi:hypothetical protein